MGNDGLTRDAYALWHGDMPGERSTEVVRYAAFTTDPEAGNPAGVVLDAHGLSDAEMLRIAADVGFSETAFLVQTSDTAFDVRYFSPAAEVPFCGHATIASAIALVDHGRVRAGTEVSFATVAGNVAVRTHPDSDGRPVAQLTSVATTQHAVGDADLVEALRVLRWSTDDLDHTLPPKVAFAGANHLVLAANSRERLADLDYDFERLRALMTANDWTTVQLIWRESPGVYHARDPFPVGGVVEDPATGAAAAAFGGYLRDLGLITAPAEITIHQGEDMGRPSRLTVDIPAGIGQGVRVSGHAVRMP